MPVVERDGVRLAYERAGSGNVELVFVHGWCCDHTFYQPQFDYFSGTCSVTAVDLRGCGASDRPATGYDIGGLADDVAWTCNALGIAHPVVVGHSLGGMIAIEVGARYPTLPRAIVADDPGPVNPLPATRRVYEGFAAQLDGPCGEAARRAWVEDVPGPTAHRELRARIVETMCAVPLEIAAAAIHGVVAWNGVAALAMCPAPVLVLGSGPGGSNTPERLLDLKADLYYGMTVGAGHCHQLEVPDQVNAMIERFLRIVTPEPIAEQRRPDTPAESRN